MMFQGNSLATVLLVALCSLSVTWGVPVQPQPSVQQSPVQLTPQDESMMYTAASYLLGRWLAAAPRASTTPQVAVTSPEPIATSAPLATTVAPLPPTVSKQSKRTELEDSSSGYSLLNLFMVVLRAVLGNNNGQQQAVGSSQVSSSGQKCACGNQNQASSNSPTAGDSLSQTAMKALLMVVSDVLTNQMTSNVPASTAPVPSRGYFW